MSLLRHAALTAPRGIACEFGVFQGISLAQIRSYRKPPVFGFDSWHGLPEPWRLAEDTEHPLGHFACEPPSVDQFGPGVELIRGWFSDTIPQWLNETEGPVQFLHVDCDLYSSARDVLFGLNDRLQDGSVILFDELIDFENRWYTNWREGEWRALTEWLAECGRTVAPLARTNQQQVAFVVKGN